MISNSNILAVGRKGFGPDGALKGVSYRLLTGVRCQELPGVVVAQTVVLRFMAMISLVTFQILCGWPLLICDVWLYHWVFRSTIWSITGFPKRLLQVLAGGCYSWFHCYLIKQWTWRNTRIPRGTTSQDDAKRLGTWTGPQNTIFFWIPLSSPYSSTRDLSITKNTGWFGCISTMQ